MPNPSIVQVAASTAWNGAATFGSAVTAGNSIVVVIAGFNADSTSGPTFSELELGGIAVPGTRQVPGAYASGTFDNPSLGGQPAATSVAAWIIPGIPGGATGLTAVASANQPGMIAFEVANLGLAPQLDLLLSANGQGDSESSGTSGGISSAGQLVIGTTCGFESEVVSGPGAPWTATLNGTSELSAGWAVSSAEGTTYAYATVNSGNNGNAWASVLVSLVPGSPVPGSDIQLRSAGTPVASGSPAFGAPTVAGDLGISWIFSSAAPGTMPYTISEGWTVCPAGAGGSFEWGAIAYKQDLGASESPPAWTVAGGTPSSIESMVATFSNAAVTGGPAGTPVNGGTGGASGQTAQMGAPDAVGGCLVVGVAGWNGGASAPTILNGITDSTGTPVTVTAYDNSGASNFIYDFTWGVAGATGADADAVTAILSAFSEGGCGIAVFAPAAASGAPSLLMASGII